MAVSSILKNITICDEESAKRLVEALELAEQRPPLELCFPTFRVVRAPEEIRAIVAKSVYETKNKDTV